MYSPFSTSSHSPPLPSIIIIIIINAIVIINYSRLFSLLRKYTLKTMLKNKFRKMENEFIKYH
jgi:hypothetical protein